MTPEEIDLFYLDFGRRVRAAREARGFTQQQLAGQLGLTRSSVANIEAGRQRTLLHVAAAMAAAVGATSADLLPSDVAPPASASIARDLRKLSDANRQAVEMLLRRTALSADSSVEIAQ